MISGIINISIFPNFCEMNEEYLKINKCQIFKNDKDILNILKENINSPLLNNLSFIGLNSEINILNENEMNIFYQECYYNIKSVNNIDKNEIAIITLNNISQINYFFVDKNKKEFLDSEVLCKQYSLNDLTKTVNNDYIIDIKSLINPSIKYSTNFPNDFFKISIKNDLKGIIYNNDDEIIIKNEIYNLTSLKYKIKYNMCFYNEEIKIQLYKNKKKEGNESLIYLSISPFYCKDILLGICYTNLTINNLIDLIHQNIINITCINQRIIKELNNNYTIQIYDSQNNLNKKISKTIELGENCENIIRKENFLSKEDKIIILIIDNNKENEFSYEVYNEKGEKLDISSCNKITLINPIDESILDLSKIKNIQKLGYDVFDEESPIYNDKCISLSVNGNDMIIEDRKDDVYNFINPCLKDCNYRNFDEINNLIYCICKLKFENSNINDDINKENLLISTYKKINLRPISCYKLLSKFENLKKNYGFYIFNFFILIHIISFYSLIKYEFVQLKSKMFNTDNHKKNLNLNQNNLFIHHNNNTLNSGNSFRKLVKRKKKKKIEKKIDFIKLNKYSFHKAINEDKRSFTLIFLDILTDKLLILKAIIKKSPFDLRTLNLSLFILHLSLIFILNALFYNDKIISEKYYNNGLSLFTNLFRSILSSLVSIIIFSFFKSLPDYISKLYTLLSEYNDRNIYTIITYNFIQKITKKMIIYFILVLLLTISFLYYIILFCSLYKSSQSSWIQGVLSSFFISNIVETILCIIVALIRKLSFHYTNEYIYNFYLFLYNKI